MQKSAKIAAEEQQRIATERQAFDLERANEQYQQQIYKDLLDAMYTLDKDGKLNDSAAPWAFANAHYRAAHREFDAIRKAQALLFLKERQLIGRQQCTTTTGCEERNGTDIINLTGLSFDYLNLTSDTGNLSRLDLSCIEFDRVSMINAIFSHTNLNGVIFRNSRLNGAKFQDSSLNCSQIINTELHGTNFYNLYMNGALFRDVTLSTMILTQKQQKEIRFDNVILPNGTKITSAITTTEMTTLQSTTPSITRVMIPNIAVNANWSPNSVIVAGGNGNGSGLNQPLFPYGLYVDDDDPMIFIADSGNHRIMQWKIGDTVGQVVAGGNDEGKRLDQLSKPSDVLIDKESNSLIICDQGNDRIVRWFSRIKATQGGLLTDTFGCHTLAIDDQRYLYVSDPGKHEVRRYHLDGNMEDETVVASWKWSSTIGTNHFYYIFVDRQHSVYVSQSTLGQGVMKWNKGEKKGIVVAGSRKEGNNSLQLGKPRGVFVDALGTVYVVDGDYKRVTRWPQGAVQSTIIVNETAHLSYPTDLSVDRHGSIYVVDSINNCIQRFSIQPTGILI